MYRKIRKVFIALSAGLVIFIAVNLFVLGKARPYTQNPDPSAYVAIVLGARVYPSGRLSPMLEDRIQTALELYQRGKVKRILVSGDHGRVEYDEVNAMKDYLLAAGVPASDIFLDHAGFDTYDSLYRAKHIFQVNSAIVVTQEFHLPRAVYIARSIGLDAVGMAADKRPYASIRYNKLREWPSRFKAFLNIVLHVKPQYLGEVLPIIGDASVSWDL